MVIGNHSVSLGFEYEQRTDRGWSNGDQGPTAIWSIARQLMNFHIRELDYTTGVITDSGSFKAITYDRLNSGYAHLNNGEFGGQINNDNQSFFDYLS